MTFDQICDSVEKHPEIESSSVQKIRAKDYVATTKDKSGLPNKRITKRTEYRVFIRTSADKDPADKLRGKVNFQTEGPDLMACVREAFTQCGLTPPHAD